MARGVLVVDRMTARAQKHQPKPETPTDLPHASQNRAPDAPPEPDPLGQSPEDPIEFCADDEVARGNEERANAEPEPPALHDAQVPGKPDAAEKRRELAAEIEAEREGN